LRARARAGGSALGPEARLPAATRALAARGAAALARQPARAAPGDRAPVPRGRDRGPGRALPRGGFRRAGALPAVVARRTRVLGAAFRDRDRRVSGAPRV